MIPESILGIVEGFSGDFGWMLQVFGVVLVTLIAGTIVRHLLKKLIKRTRDTDNMFDDVLFEALLGPSRGLIWIIGIASAAHIVGRQTEAVIFDAVETLRNVGIIGMVMWFAVRFVSVYERRYIERKTEKGEAVDKTFVNAVSKLFRAAAIITSGLVILQILGINIAGLVAFGGVGGIAVGFAARDVIANMFGGLTIYLDRPFAVGDWIRSPDR